MPTIHVNGVELYYEAEGEGPPLVFVHGGWSSLHNWDAVAPALTESFWVVRYDRRGHGQSSRPPDHGSRRDQENDLAALIVALDCGPAHVVGTSFGASIAIGLASRRPDVVASVIAHEPPLMSLVADDPKVQPVLSEVQVSIQSVLARLARGEHEEAARQFVEEVALGPGAWELLPEPLRQTMIDSGPAFAAEQRDPHWADIDARDVAAIELPVCLTQGDQSPPWFPGIIAGLAKAMDHADLMTYPGAGHAPHITHPSDYVAGVRHFLAPRALAA
jgi:pimeloyl-ACP methyl ester carboxylesterase